MNGKAIVVVAGIAVGAVGGFFGFFREDMRAIADAEAFKAKVARAPVARVCGGGALVRIVDGRPYVDGRGRGGWVAEGVSQDRLCAE